MHSKDQLFITNLFVKYLENRCSTEEIKQLLEYFKSPSDEAILRALIHAELGFETDKHKDQGRDDQALLKVKETLEQAIKISGQAKSAKVVAIRKWFRICAIWLVLASTLALGINYLNRTFRNRKVSAALNILKTGPGERRIITLSDGTKIWLSPSSTLAYPDQLIGTLRVVKLEGEAFFEVAKDKVHPFIIHSGQMDTKVVGTSFTISAYPKAVSATVTVVTGIVKVSVKKLNFKELQNVTLTPNHQSRYDIQNNTLTGADYPDAVQMLKRKDGILSYDGMPVQQVLNDLRHYYRQPITRESWSGRCLCYGEFDTNKPISIVLAQLAAAINAKLIVKDNKYILKGGCE